MSPTKETIRATQLAIIATRVPTPQDLFVQQAPNALHPDFIYKKADDDSEQEHSLDSYTVVIQQAKQQTGITDSAGNLLDTTIWGYGDKSENDTALQVSWPGKTFEVKCNKSVKVNWINNLKNPAGDPLEHLFPVDTSIHWCYGLPGYESVNIAKDGVPLVSHLHGAHADPGADGYPESFVGLSTASRGPSWKKDTYVYDNSQSAGTLWYHDHTLGITRLNVYAGLAGFYIMRDKQDTGKHSNPLGLPAKQYELAYCIQDRMFTNTGELHFPTNTRVTPPNPGPSLIAEFMGDHILVNGKIWPKTNVEPRHYRLRLLSGCDSRFMRLRFRMVPAGAKDFANASDPLDFYVIGSDQGLLRNTATVKEVDFIPGERVDVVFDFASVPKNSRVIIENILGDGVFGGPITPFNSGSLTDRLMAFDVTLDKYSDNGNHCDDDDDSDSDKHDDGDEQDEIDGIRDRFNKQMQGSFQGVSQTAVRTRKLGLFEGTDQHDRVMPMLGTAEEVNDVTGAKVNGSLIWDAAITENPAVGDTEIWEFYNATADAHPIHIHLVHFEILSRSEFTADRIQITTVLPNKETREGFRLDKILLGASVPVLASEDGPKDMVLCYPNQVTRVKMTFDKPGRFVWHCHILSHEDHEMMRPFHVGPL